MTRPEARAILDAARAGADVPASRIVAALVATGDVPTTVPGTAQVAVLVGRALRLVREGEAA